MKHDDPRTNDAVAHEIRRACDGAIYVSETDAPVELFIAGDLPELSEELIRKVFDPDGNQPIEIADAGRFFDRYRIEPSRCSSTQEKIAGRFLHLRNVLEEHLSCLKLVRIGRVQVTIYILGRDRNGRIMGVVTHAVET